MREANAFRKFGITPNYFKPVIDGALVHDDPWNLMDQGKLPNDVPVIIGTNKDEGVILLLEFYFDEQYAMDYAINNLEEFLALYVFGRYGLFLISFHVMSFFHFSFRTETATKFPKMSWPLSRMSFAKSLLEGDQHHLWISGR